MSRSGRTLRCGCCLLAHSTRFFVESFVIFQFGLDSDAMLKDVVSSEHLKNAFSVEGERETYLHRLAFQTLVSASLDPEESRRLIVDTARSRWSNDRVPA